MLGLSFCQNGVQIKQTNVDITSAAPAEHIGEVVCRNHETERDGKCDIPGG